MVRTVLVLVLVCACGTPAQREGGGATTTTTTAATEGPAPVASYDGVSAERLAHQPVDPRAWNPIANVEELAARTRAAARGERSVIVQYVADWCTPCKTMEREVFADPRVEKALASYERLAADVSDSSDDDEAMQVALEAENLPAILIYRDATALAAYLDGKGPKPEPDVHVDRLLSADEFLARLAAMSR